MKLKKITMLLAATIIGTSTFGQSVDKKRVEFKLKEEYSRYLMNNYGENGIILTSIKTHKKKEAYEYKFEKYNTDLQLAETITINVPANHWFTKGFKHENNWYALIGDKKGEKTILIVDAIKLTHKKVKMSVPLPPKMYSKEYFVAGNGLFINGTLKKQEIIYHVNLTTGKTKLINISYKK